MIGDTETIELYLLGMLGIVLGPWLTKALGIGE